MSSIPPPTQTASTSASVPLPSQATNSSRSSSNADAQPDLPIPASLAIPSLLKAPDASSSTSAPSRRSSTTSRASIRGPTTPMAAPNSNRDSASTRTTTNPVAFQLFQDSLAQESAGNIDNARRLIVDSLAIDSRNVEAWLEALRLYRSSAVEIKSVARNVMQELCKKEDFWLNGYEREKSDDARRDFLRRGVAHIPTSLSLWLILAHNTPLEESKSVLNAARRAIPTSHTIWISACQLLERESRLSYLPQKVRTDKLIALRRMVEVALDELRRNGVVLAKEEWEIEAERCLRLGWTKTADALLTIAAKR